MSKIDRGVTLFVAIVLIAVFVSGCVTAGVTEDGSVALGVSPLASLSRVQAGEQAVGEAIASNAEAVTTLSEATATLAGRVEGAEGEVAKAAEAGKAAQDGLSELEKKASEIGAKDFADTEYFWLLLAALGLGGVPAGKAGFNKLRKKKEPVAT